MILQNELLSILIVVVFGFITGLEVKNYKEQFSASHDDGLHLGSTRTYTFLALLGYVFYKISLNLYIVGFAGFIILYAMFYFFRLKEQRGSLLLFLIGGIVYSFGAFVSKFGYWELAVLFVLVVFILNSKYKIKKYYEQIDIKEIETFSKFLVLSAVILPILPKNNLPYIEISAFKIWLAVVVISGISYVSYILSKFVFKDKGFLVAGILGGLYSSTATTVVLSKKVSISKEIINGAIIIATSMMYLRLVVIAFIFNSSIGKSVLIPYLVLSLIGIAIAVFFYQKGAQSDTAASTTEDQNPLELQTALIFAFLFVAMMALTKYITLNFGDAGLQVLSFIAGVSDIDPFVLSLLMGKFHITQELITSAIFIATGSNNFLKAFYAYFFGKKGTLSSVITLIGLGCATIILGFI